MSRPDPASFVIPAPCISERPARARPKQPYGFVYRCCPPGPPSLLTAGPWWVTAFPGPWLRREQERNYLCRRGGTLTPNDAGSLATWLLSPHGAAGRAAQVSTLQVNVADLPARPRPRLATRAAQGPSLGGSADTGGPAHPEVHHVAG